jgi:hypothetical protein
VVRRKYSGQDSARDEHSHHELRQIVAEIFFECLDALGKEADQLSCPGAGIRGVLLEEPWPKSVQMRVEATAEIRLNSSSEYRGRSFSKPDKCSSQQDHTCQRYEQRRCGGKASPMNVHQIGRQADQPGLEDACDSAKESCHDHQAEHCTMGKQDGNDPFIDVQ